MEDINFEKEFISLKESISLCYLKWGYPVALIAQIFKVTEKSAQLFIDEGLKKMTTKYDYLLIATMLTGFAGCGDTGRMLPTTPTFPSEKEICELKCSPLINETKYQACLLDCINDDFSTTITSGTITIIPQYPAAVSGTITF